MLNPLVCAAFEDGEGVDARTVSQATVSCAPFLAVSRGKFSCDENDDENPETVTKTREMGVNRFPRRSGHPLALLLAKVWGKRGLETAESGHNLC